jgi:zinc transport system substrate-binding protein
MLAQANYGHCNGNTPKSIVASIAPFYNLAAAVLGPDPALHLLVPAGLSVHGYTLKPSERQLWQTAEWVIYGGAPLETFLSPLLAQSQAGQPRYVELSSLPGLQLLPLSASGGCACNQHASNQQAGASSAVYDPHFWLSPANARIIVQALCQQFSAAYPAEAPRYLRNMQQFLAALARLEQQLAKQLASVAQQPFVVYHDAYRYFLARYPLQLLGPVTLQPELPLRAGRMALLKQWQQQGLQCVFSEPQFAASPTVLALAAKHGVLDPLGASADLGPTGYLRLLSNLGDALVQCLGHA